MMMKKITFILVSLFAVLAACSRKEVPALPQLLNTGSNEAVAPCFTRDARQNPVLCWTEKDKADSLYRLKYAVYNARTRQFNTPITVPASAGCSNAAESMPRVAFKADGTVLAVFAKRFPNEKNPYAGAIYYSISKDQGLNWSAARFLHSDTAHTYGRSFFDVARLKDGELGAIWLDGRYGKNSKGSALFFARTTAGKGFAADTCLTKGTCECCRTAIFSDEQGNIHLAYRNINYPAALSDRQVRDMAYQLSADQGKTFSTARPISNDNWEIIGCPHSGPSLAISKGTVQAVWFTAGGGAGLYHAALPASAADFSPRKLITAAGRHPQLISMKNGKLLMVCEEAVSAETGKAMEMNHAHGKMEMAHAKAGSAKIMLYSLTASAAQKPVEITDGTAADNHAVLTSVADEVLMAWVREEKSGARIYYTSVALTE